MVVLAVAGLGLAVIGYLGWRARLPRNRFAGVRTPAAMRSDDAFRVANQVAGIPVMVAGLVGVFGGVAAFFLPSAPATVTALVIVVLGMGGLAVAGGVLGSRAAGAVPEPRAGGCAGCCCGGCG
ncbi:SdpI family protein [Gandjariella thermophila]|uniref:SdpI family protein n=1 Tax=Gandjariella thermophila TaxID=1931992 RepID=UPI0010F69155